MQRHLSQHFPFTMATLHCIVAWMGEGNNIRYGNSIGNYHANCSWFPLIIIVLLHWVVVVGVGFVCLQWKFNFPVSTAAAAACHTLPNPPRTGFNSIFNTTRIAVHDDDFFFLIKLYGIQLPSHPFSAPVSTNACRIVSTGVFVAKL